MNMTCASCTRTFTRESDVDYCPHCGGRLPAVITSTIEAHGTGAAASRPARVGAMLIDLLIALIPAVLDMIPGIGQALYGLILAVYWLMRDINGASFGKALLKMRVVDQSGAPSTTRQRILRNVPLALPAIGMAIPFLGLVLGPLAEGSALIIESVVLLLAGRRIGDMIAGTKVVR
jgi:uncharacterized RDD family membrane protein YckC